MKLTESKVITNDSIINVSVKVTNRRCPITPFDRQRIYWRAKHMNDIPTPKRGSLKNICNYYRVTEEDVFQIVAEESIREERCYYYWVRKIGQRIMTSDIICDKSILPNTIGTIESVDNDGLINVLWDNGNRSKIEEGKDLFFKTWL